MYDIIIIGAGPAGMTAALYGLRANKKVLIIEKKCYGGQIINASVIENYPGIEKITGFDFATNLYNQIMKLGVLFKNENVIKIRENKVYTNKNEYASKAIIIATGCENRRLNINNEEKFIGAGISYCATCDGNFYKGKKVAIVGGGNTALEDTIYLSNICETVYLIHRRDNFRGENKLLDELKEKKNVKILRNSRVVELLGNNKLTGIQIECDEIKRNLELDGLFIAVGQEPKSEVFADILNIDKNGYIISEDGVHTNYNCIYIAGDVRQKELRQLTTAIADGALAATTAIKEMEGEKNG